jgi:hypothetical protein
MICGRKPISRGPHAIGPVTVIPPPAAASG